MIEIKLRVRSEAANRYLTILDHLRLNQSGLARGAGRVEIVHDDQQVSKFAVARFAEVANWRPGFKIKRATDHIAIELIEDDPESKIGIKASATFLDCRDLNAETPGLRLFRGYRTEEYEVSVRPRDAHANSDGPVFAALRLSLAGKRR